MKGTRTGIATILVMLIGLPAIIDLVMLTAVPRGVPFFSLTIFVTLGCIKVFPFYIMYLLGKRLASHLWNELNKIT